MNTITSTPFGLAAPQVAGPLAVFPVLAREPRSFYRSLSAAVRLGAFVKEASSSGIVEDVLAHNPTDEPLLIYEGEIIEGARQNRSFDAHVLVPAHADLVVPVSCVERRRWEEGQRDQHFAPAAHAPDPELRRVKRAHANAASRAGAEARADQLEVWNEVHTRLSARHVHSASDALSDVFRAAGPRLEELREQIRHVDGQVGAVVQIEGRPVALDLVGRADVFADLLPRLAAGYALQGLGAKTAAPSGKAAHGFLFAALEAPRRWLPTPGMGDLHAISQPGLQGSALALGRELVALTAFPADKQTVYAAA